ncbi:MAG TPA: protein kinase [Bryobacteraceae bacterium]|nr:protein kinase [Bryobacteraceae bacterium]
MSLASGTILGPYRILGPLGAGGMGEVYRARDSRLGRDVALKTLPPEYARDPAFRQRFAQEARAVAALNHPNIVAMYDVGTQGDVAYMVTELVDGEPLRGGSLGLRKMLDLAVQIAEGLAAAHQAGVVHRDLKPSNILVTREGRAKILDFGLAKIQTAQSAAAGGERPTQAITEPGVVMGTIGYMSPEQVKGGLADYRSDIFSFGVILHELLAGKRTFQAETAAETMTAILKHDAPELPESVPPTVREIVGHCLEKDPGSRFQSAKDLSFALAHSGSPSGKQAALPPPPSRVRRVLLPIAAVVLLAAGALVGRFVWHLPVPAVWNGVMLGGPEVAYFPRPSPDGHLVAFVGNDPDDVMQVWVMKPDNRMMLSHNRERGAVQTCSWSADGNRIYYDRWYDQPKGVFSVPALGGDEQLVLEDAMMPEALADGSLLLVRINPEHRYQVFRYWPDTGKLQGYPIEVSNFYSAIRASPAGHRAMVLGTAMGPGAAPGIHVFVIDLASGNMTQLPEESPGEFSDAPAGAAFTRDGKSALAISRHGNTYRVTSIPFDKRAFGAAPHTLLSLTQAVYSLDIGPDGNVYLDQSDRPKDLLRFPPAGGHVERIATVSSEMGDDNFAVLPDGRAVWMEQAGGRRRLILVEQGKDPVPLVNTRQETSWPMTAAGPGEVAFMLGRERQTIALAALSNGRITRQIPFDKGAVSAMAAAPDGKTLYCAAAGTIWAVSLAGEMPRKIATGDSVVVDPATQSLLVEMLTPPDTRLVRIPLGGGPEQTIAGSFHLGLGIDPGSIAGGKLVAPMASPYWFDPPGLFDLATGESTRVPLDYRGDFHHMAWTPDGNIMAVAAGWRATLWKFSAGR